MKRFDMEKARQLSQAVRSAQDEMTAYLQAHFPRGARCEVLLNASQKNPTLATISGAHGDVYGGTVVVEIDTAKPRSRLRFRRVSPSVVSNVIAPTQAPAIQDAQDKEES